MIAVNEGHQNIVQGLVSAGADVLIKDKVCGVMECVIYNLQDKIRTMSFVLIIAVKSEKG